MTIKHCCDRFAEHVWKENIDVWENKPSFYIYGRPSGADDGDGYYYDMTDKIEIFYCPFCGKKLK